MWFSRRQTPPPPDSDDAPTEIVRPAPPPPSAVAWAGRGALVAVGATSVVPVLNYIAFGTLAREAGLPLPETLIAAAGIWWVSGQVVITSAFAHNMMVAPTALSVGLSAIPLLPMVVSVLPLFGRNGRRLWLALPIAQTVATVPWAVAQQRLPGLPEAGRLPFFAGYAALFMTLCLGAAVVAHVLAAGLPPSVRALLVFVLPLHLLFSAVGSARDATTWLAILTGVVAGPWLRPVAGDFTLLAAGVGGGTAAFLSVRLWRRLFRRVVP